MLDGIEKVSTFIAGFDFDRFCSDDKTVFAVIRGIELIGEAARNVHQPFAPVIPKSRGGKYAG
jgi:uncharacterized protein with HEPN domain